MSSKNSISLLNNQSYENLKEAINGESYEFSTMYPNFIKNAHAAGNYMAQISLTYAYKVEQKHLIYTLKHFRN
jgi:rubrerythrin